MSTTTQWHIGCSGFHYKEWKNVFYPEKLAATKWFEYYCQHFNTLELNTTFYRFPQLKTLQEWYTRSHPGIKSAHIYFNNTAGPAALANARWLIDRVK